MKVILVSFLMLISTWGKANSHKEAEKPDEKTLKAALVQEVVSLIEYPQLQLAHMDVLEADIYFSIDREKTLKVHRVVSKNAELTDYLLYILSEEKLSVQAMESNKVYALKVRFK